MSSRSLPDLTIRQLEYLVAVVDSDTWADAAASIGVSPSALSQGLAELERRLGVDLFEARGRRRVLRRSARPALDHARQVISLTEDVTGWARRVRGAEVGRVRLGMIDVAAVMHYPEVIRSFRRDVPDVELTLTVSPSGSLVSGLERGELDLVVCVEPPAPRVGLIAVPVLDEPLIVYGPPGHVAGPPATWGPWVLFPADSHTRRAVVDALRQVGARLEIAAESHQPDVLRAMVVLGLGSTVLPRSQGSIGHPALSAGTTLLSRRLVLVRRDGAVSDPAVDELERRLRAHSVDVARSAGG